MKIQNITILNDAVSITLREVLTSILNTLTSTGIILTIIGVILLIIFAVISSYNQKRIENIEQSEEE